MKKELFNLEKLTYDEFCVYNVIGKSKDNLSTKSYISNLTGYKEREIKSIIHSLREKGIPVCSQVTNGGGYWIETDKAEFGRFVAQQKIQVEGYIKALETMIDIYKSLEGDDSNELFI